jgi:cytochrome b
MRQKLVYDLPTRVFHWLFAGLFLVAFAIGKGMDDDSTGYSYHMLAGLTLGFVVLLRVIWGFMGTRHARFTGFALQPAELLGYLKGILSGDKKRWAGHNPASSWAAITMMLLALGLGVTGYLMTSGAGNEALKEVHELFANALIVIVVLHLTGIVLHTLRHREWIGLSMIDGKKEQAADPEVIPSSKTAFGVILLVLTVIFGANLLKNYDSAGRKLPFFGTELQLGENGDEHDD